MNILYLIGNGFDLNLNLKTRYKDFYDYYLKKENHEILIQNLKKDISEKEQNWSDLELQLGKYSNELKNIDELDLVTEDLIVNLSEYLNEIENKFDISSVDKDLFLNHLCNPENNLLPDDKITIQHFKRVWSNTTNWNLNIMTFNYTRIIEKILSDDIENTLIGGNNKNKILLKRIEHIHGYLNNRMVLGVNDVSQLKNELFHNDIDALETIVKSNSIEATKESVDKRCELEISRANLICVFGSSFGYTDAKWWEQIGERLLNKNAKLIIFNTTKNLKPNLISYKNQRTKRLLIERFIQMTKLESNEADLIRNSIYINLNSNMFKILKPK